MPGQPVAACCYALQVLLRLLQWYAQVGGTCKWTTLCNESNPWSAHLSTSTVRATSLGFHCSWGVSRSTPLAGPTVVDAVTKRFKSNSSETMRCRASADSGAALEYCKSQGRAANGTVQDWE